MNIGVCVRVSLSAEILTCGIYLVPEEMLPPQATAYTLYTQAQLEALAPGRAIVPGLQAVAGAPSVLQMAAAIPQIIPAGTTMPEIGTLLKTSAATWDADQIYVLSEAEIPPYCNPNEPAPSLAAAWCWMATLTYATAASRSLFNPDDYEPPVEMGGDYSLYFPKPDRFLRSRFEIMEDVASAAGMYWYRSFSSLHPAYIYLYAIPGSPFLVHPTGEPPHPFLEINVGSSGVSLTDNAFMYTRPQDGFTFRVDAYTSKWINTLVDNITFQKMYVGPSGFAGKVISALPGHWRAGNTPARLRPTERRKVAGIVAPVTALFLLWGLLSIGSAASAVPGRRRKS